MTVQIHRLAIYLFIVWLVSFTPFFLDVYTGKNVFTFYEMCSIFYWFSM